ncbi:MAG: hypothetical protein H7644_06765 [Candidatus Heimdallarchaeota archaeon]|nr:hypothetical protein [Candidatus Heimdallarchaeota archaeon]MCK5143450.1 hypothetical protein [Candidatus Heimdallarchaeota archaeon]
MVFNKENKRNFPAKSDYGIFVSLDIYSGKPDPYWKLTDEQIEELKLKLKDLPETKMIIPEKYAHHGFRIYNKDKIQPIPQRIEVFRKVVSYRKKRKVHYFEDINNIEDWLFSLAIEQGYEEVVNRVKNSE